MRGPRGTESSGLVGTMRFRRVRALILAALMGMAVAGAVPAAAQPGSVSLTSLDIGGAQAVVLASFDAAGSTTLWSASGSRWDAQGRLVEGDVALDDDSRIVRVTAPEPDGSLLRLNDDGPLNLREFFASSGADADLTVWVHTSAGTASFAASDVNAAGDNYVNFDVPQPQRAVIAAISAGDRFVLALTRPASPPDPHSNPDDDPSRAQENGQHKGPPQGQEPRNAPRGITDTQTDDIETRPAPTNAAPAFPDTDSDGTADAVSRTIAENTTTGNLDDAIIATDTDTLDTLAYSVAATSETDGDDHLVAFNRDFELDAASGQISVNSDAMIDFETLASYKVTYQVTDGKDSANNSEATPTIDDTLTLTVDVDDVEVENFLTINDVTVTEPASGFADATFTVTVSPALPAGSSPVLLEWSTGTGADPDTHWALGRNTDYGDVSYEQLTFNAGETSKTISVTVAGDSLDEWDEEFFVLLEGPEAPLGFADGEKELAGYATILDSDVPIASITPASEALEGSPLAITISLDIASSRDLDVEYATPSRSFNTAGVTDYTVIPFGTTVRVPAGSTSASVQVQTTEDTVAEVDEEFLVLVDAVILARSDLNEPRVVVGSLSVPNIATAATILDDEPRVVIDTAASTAEDTSGGATVPVRLVDRDGNSMRSTDAVTVTFSTEAVSGAVHGATAGPSTDGSRDYTSVSGGSLTIAANQSTGTATVSLHDDALDEYDETFAVKLSAVSANVHLGGFESGSALHTTLMTSSVVTIEDDDLLPVVSVAAASANEGDKLSFKVSLNVASGRPVTARWFTENDGTRQATLFTHGDPNDVLDLSPRGMAA